MGRVPGILAAAAAFVALSFPAAAQDSHLPGEEIAARIAGRAFAGQTPLGDAYEETYTADGAIEGLWNGSIPYGGSWWIEGDAMCFDYPDAPEASGCWFVTFEQGVATWRDGRGEIAATMTLAR